MSSFSFLTLVGMPLDWVVFDSSKFFISLIISIKVTFLNENGKSTSDGTCFFSLEYLGGFQIFLLHLIPGYGGG